MILYPGENSWNTVRLDKRNYTAQKAKEQQKELIIDALEMLAE